jgi:hypothetical protein
MNGEMKEAMIIFCIAAENKRVLLPNWVYNQYLNFCRILKREDKICQ